MRSRDEGIARLRRATRIAILGATALAGAFATLAAHSAPGHKAPSATSRRTSGQAQASASAQAPLQVQSDEQEQVPSQAATPAVTPQPTVAPPVAVTGAT